MPGYHHQTKTALLPFVPPPAHSMRRRRPPLRRRRSPPIQSVSSHPSNACFSSAAGRVQFIRRGRGERWRRMIGFFFPSSVFLQFWEDEIIQSEQSFKSTSPRHPHTLSVAHTPIDRKRALKPEKRKNDEGNGKNENKTKLKRREGKEGGNYYCKGKGREGKERKGKGREGKGREGKGREGKGREGKGRDEVDEIQYEYVVQLRVNFY
ncbi:hypothetical protein niasHT_016041 [Heterodera trifolii]|uniref:Uncharacterized protein n=1 Tax=Heterodera trifolii TaxID=157864 RepID=A0ABD2LEW3_9BILA